MYYRRPIKIIVDHLRNRKKTTKKTKQQQQQQQQVILLVQYETRVLYLTFAHARARTIHF